MLDGLLVHYAAAANKSVSAFAPTLKALHRFLQGSFGIASQTLLDFGMKAQQPMVKAAEVNAGAMVKGAATRVARHTKGKRQKASIRGKATPAPGTTNPDPEAPCPTSRT